MPNLSHMIRGQLSDIDFPLVDSHARFVAWMKFAHGIMLSSPALLDFAAIKAEGELRRYYQHHADEERDHAAWMQEDLKVLGEQPELVDHAVASIAGAQYYYLQHVGPHALLGYCAAMEFRPMPMESVEALAKVVGEDAVRTIRYHAMHDPEHGDALAHIIDKCRDYADIIMYSALMTRRTLQFYLNERMSHA